MIPAQFKVDIFSEIERIIHQKYVLFVLDRTLEELENIIQKQKGKHKEAAKIALQLIKIKNIQVIKTNSKELVDDLILECASKEDYIVCTQDKDLKRKLSSQNNSVIVLKQKKTLILVNDKGF